jgi:hypothetical protein
VLQRVLANAPGEAIRASVERRILAVDAGARADGALVPAASTNRKLAALVARGFTKAHLAELLGAESPALQLGDRARVTLATRARVERLWRKVARGEVTPRHDGPVPAPEERAWLLALLDKGVTADWLSGRLGFIARRADCAGETPAAMWPANAAAVRALRAELEQLVREGAGLPDDWQFPESARRALVAGFGFEGGYLIRGRGGAR